MYTCVAGNMLTNSSVTVQRKLIRADTDKMNNSHVKQLYKNYIWTKLMDLIHCRQHRESRVPVQNAH
jgi:hypothetical protein